MFRILKQTYQLGELKSCQNPGLQSNASLSIAQQPRRGAL